MLILVVKWWYGPGWLKAFNDIHRRTAAVSHEFSIPILIKTLFAPWKRYTTYPGKSVDAIIRALIDNFVSRLVGFWVRLLVLISAGVICLFTLIVSAVVALAWPLIPLGVIFLILKGVAG